MSHVWLAGWGLMQDGGHCGEWTRCPIPALSLTRWVWGDSGDILLPYMYGIKHPAYLYPWQLKEDRVGPWEADS